MAIPGVGCGFHADIGAVQGKEAGLVDTFRINSTTKGRFVGSEPVKAALHNKAAFHLSTLQDSVFQIPVHLDPGGEAITTNIELIEALHFNHTVAKTIRLQET